MALWKEDVQTILQIFSFVKFGHRAMQLIEDDDVETMIALYCWLGNVEPIELFTELADVESVQNATPLNQ